MKTVNRLALADSPVGRSNELMGVMFFLIFFKLFLNIEFLEQVALQYEGGLRGDKT